VKKVYWDTSALINSVVSADVAARLQGEENWTRLHSLCEAFGIMTGRGLAGQSGTVRFTFTAERCAEWLENLLSNVSTMELSRAEVLSAIKSADKFGVKGRRIHDLLHAAAADRIKADILLTRDTQDFTGIAKAKLEWP
jgi:predicted nucleic acid-binding protein